MSGRLDRIMDWEEQAVLARYRVSTLALTHGVTSRHLDRYFHERFGSSPKVALRQMQMEAALRLMTGGMTIKEVAHALGFHHSTHFCRAFKRAYGCSPSRYLALPFGNVAANVRSGSQMSDLGHSSALLEQRSREQPRSTSKEPSQTKHL